MLVAIIEIAFLRMDAITSTAIQLAGDFNMRLIPAWISALPHLQLLLSGPKTQHNSLERRYGDVTPYCCPFHHHRHHHHHPHPRRALAATLNSVGHTTTVDENSVEYVSAVVRGFLQKEVQTNRRLRDVLGDVKPSTQLRLEWLPGGWYVYTIACSPSAF